MIGISERQMRRWKKRYEAGGFDGLLDRRRGVPSRRRVPQAQAEQVVSLYRDQYFDLNVRHFHEKLVAEHQIGLSYTWVKQALQAASLVKRKSKRGEDFALSRGTSERPNNCATRKVTGSEPITANGEITTWSTDDGPYCRKGNFRLDTSGWITTQTRAGSIRDVSVTIASMLVNHATEDANHSSVRLPNRNFGCQSWPENRSLTRRERTWGPSARLWNNLIRSRPVAGDSIHVPHRRLRCKCIGQGRCANRNSH